VASETLIVAAAVVAAAVLSSLPPPARALAAAGGASARVGPGPVRQVVSRNGYKLEFRVSPNKVAVPNTIAVTITRNSRPVHGATVIGGFAMLDMEMGTQSYRLDEVAPGLYQRSAPVLVMVGHWSLAFQIEPPGGQPFRVLFVDRATG
jgi:copper transport protein